VSAVANLDQLACAVQSVVASGPAAGCRAIDLRVLRGIDLRLLPDRGLDLGAAWFRGVPLAWISPAGETAPLAGVPRGEDWLRAFGGGLVTTCGLRNVGAPSEGHGLHGEASHQRARDVRVEREGEGAAAVLRVRGRFAEAGALGDLHLEVRRTITTRTGAGVVELADVTTNRGSAEQAAPLLYHVNLGAPLWAAGAELELDARRTLPRDADAAVIARAWRQAPAFAPGEPERVLEHDVAPGPDGWARAVVRHPDVGIEVELAWDAATLPRLHQWVHAGAGVLGLEPANCSVLGRAADRAAGRLPVLAPGERRHTALRISARPL